ncbi:MAG: methyltransferase domain-containing protein [Sulfolobales archaeon]
MRIRIDLIGKIYALLSMERIEQALIEAKVFAERNKLREIYTEPGFIIFEGEAVENLIELDRLALIKDLGEILFAIEDIRDLDEFYRSLRLLSERKPLQGDIYIRSLREKKLKPDPLKVKEILGGGSIDVDGEKRSREKISIIIGDLMIVGRSIYRRKISLWKSPERNGSATMKVIDTRFMGGLIPSKAMLVYDPFAGGGYLIYEACRSNFRIMASDINLEKILMCRTLLESNSCEDYDLFIADAFRIPIRENAVDVILSDLPYGRRSKFIGGSTLTALESLFRELFRILRSGGAFITAISHDQWVVFRESLDLKKIRYLSLQFVHGSLHRVYVYLEKKENI